MTEFVRKFEKYTSEKVWDINMVLYCLSEIENK